MILHTLYRFHAADEDLLYVGITNDPGRRFGQHKYDKEWWLNVARIDMQHFPDRKSLIEAERRAIETERPRHNIRMNGNQTYSVRHNEPRRLPKGMKVGSSYAIGLETGSCPVGLVIDGDEEGVTVTLFNWMFCMFCGDDEWIPSHLISGWRKAEVDSDGVHQMDRLEDFQSNWIKSKAPSDD